MQQVPVVLKHALINPYDRIYYAPFLLCNAVSLDVRGQIPGAKTTTNPSDLIDKLVFPVDTGMRSRSIIQILDNKGLP